MNILQGLSIPLILDNLPFKKGLDESENLAGTKGNSILNTLGSAGKVAGVAIASIGTAALGATAAVGGLFMKSVDLSGELVDQAVKMGINTTQLQELNYVSGQIGVSQEAIAGAFSKTVMSVGNAVSGNKEAVETYKQLGVSIYDSNGQLKDSQIIFNDSITALSKVTNETEQSILTQKLFGKSFAELKPLINSVGGEFASLVAQAHETGAVIGGENVSAMESFGDKVVGIQASIQGLAGTLLSGLSPAFDGVATKVQGYIADFNTLISSSNGNSSLIASGAGGLIGKILGDVVSSAPKIMSTGFALVETLVTSVIDQLPLIVDTALKMIISLATGLGIALPKLIPAIIEIIPKIVTTLLENLPLLIEAALKLIIGLASGLIQAIPVLVQAIPEIVVAIFNAIIESLPVIFKAGIELIETVIEGIQNAQAKVREVGIGIVKGVWAGISSQGTQLWNDVMNFFGNIVNGVKDFLGIRSPSRVFAGIGINLAKGLGVGFSDSFASVQSDLNSSIDNWTGGIEPKITNSLSINGSASTNPVAQVANNKNQEFDYYKFATVLRDVMVMA